MTKPIIQPTKAYELLLTNSASVLDERQMGIDAGMIMPDMEDWEAINLVNAITLFFTYDHEFSPHAYLAFLEKYCEPRYADGLMHFYPQIAVQNGVVLDDNIWTPKTQTEFVLDIHAYALKTKGFGGKRHWGLPFKEPYLTHWNDAFDGKAPDPVEQKQHSFFRKLFGR